MPGQKFKRLPLKHAGLDLPNPTLSTPDNCKAPSIFTGHLVSAIRVHMDFHSDNHANIMRDKRFYIRCWNTTSAVQVLAELTVKPFPMEICCIQWRNKIGECISIHPSTANGTELESQEWKYVMFLCRIEPLNLHLIRDGCRVKFSITHALDCKKYGLLMTCHNELCYRVVDLVRKVLSLLYVHDKPLLHTGL